MKITPDWRLLLRLLTGAAVLGSLLFVFALYTRPDFLVLLSNQIWSCF